jgi:predicted dehydrogenase
MIERLLVVGLGSAGKRHVRVARGLLPNVRIVALRRSDSVAPDEPDVERCVVAVAEALAFKPQVAVVANPATHHFAITQALIDAGVHVLIEKPLAHESSGLAELLATARQRRVTVMTAYNLRFAPSLIHFREQVRSQVVGPVLSVRAEVGQHLPNWRPQTDYRRSVSARRDLGGGVLLELSHEIDYLRWIFGEVEWVRATCARQSRLEIDVEDTAHLTLKIAPSPAGRAVIAALNLDFIRHDTTRVCTAICEGGSLRWNGITGVVEIFSAGGKEWREVFRHPPQRDETYVAEWIHFMNCVDETSQPSISGEEGLATLKIVEAARQAAESGHRVAVAPLNHTAKTIK